MEWKRNHLKIISCIDLSFSAFVLVLWVKANTRHSLAECRANMPEPDLNLPASQDLADIGQLLVKYWKTRITAPARVLLYMVTKDILGTSKQYMCTQVWTRFGNRQAVAHHTGDRCMTRIQSKVYNVWVAN